MTKVSLTDQEIRALISLLDEEDPASREHVMGRLKEVLLVEPERIETLIPGMNVKSCRQVKNLLEDVRWDGLERRFESLARVDSF